MTTERPPIRLLYIDDDRGLSRLVQKELGRHGYEVTLAADGDEGVAALDAADFDICALDHYMPGRDGIDVLPDMSGTDILAEVKQDERLKRAPVVVLTTTDDKVEIQRCYDLGCNVYITKPVDYESFADAIRQLGLFLSVMQAPDIE